MGKSRTWACDLMSRAEEAGCQLEALDRVEWKLGDEDERARLSFGIRGAKRAVVDLLVEARLAKPAYMNALELEGFDVAAWREETLATCWEIGAIVRALAVLADYAGGFDAAGLTYALEGVARMLDALAHAIDTGPPEHAADADAPH